MCALNRYVNIKGFEATNDERVILVDETGSFALKDPIFLNYNTTIIENVSVKGIDTVYEVLKDKTVKGIQIVIADLRGDVKHNPSILRALSKVASLTNTQDIYLFVIAEIPDCNKDLLGMFDNIINKGRLGGVVK